jgi:hypothetical protein
MAADVLRRIEILRALAAQKDHRAARDDGLAEVIVELLFRVGVLRVELADAGVGHGSFQSWGVAIAWSPRDELFKGVLRQAGIIPAM